MKAHKARRAETDSSDALYVFVLMHIVDPEPLDTSGRHALVALPVIAGGL
jgi:hypothetical protein